MTVDLASEGNFLQTISRNKWKLAGCFMLLYIRISRCQLASTICHTHYNTSGHVDVILLLWRQTIDLLKATHLISSMYAFNEDVCTPAVYVVFLDHRLAMVHCMYNLDMK